ncbi:MAG: hypothetical protein V6Z81_08535 [Parvularculales bacterium]
MPFNPIDIDRYALFHLSGNYDEFRRDLNKTHHYLFLPDGKRFFVYENYLVNAHLELVILNNQIARSQESNHALDVRLNSIFGSYDENQSKISRIKSNDFSRIERFDLEERSMLSFPGTMGMLSEYAGKVMFGSATIFLWSILEKTLETTGQALLPWKDDKPEKGDELKIYLRNNSSQPKVDRLIDFIYKKTNSKSLSDCKRRLRDFRITRNDLSHKFNDITISESELKSYFSNVREVFEVLDDDEKIFNNFAPPLIL